MKMPALNPFLPSNEYIPDCEPRVFGDRLYVYGSHDLFHGGDFCLGDYVCWSAPVDDLGNWRCEGTIYRRMQDPANRDGRQYLYAPDVVQGPDGRYYLFYALNLSTTISVAVCDSPAGEYEFYGNVKNPDGKLSGTKPGEINHFDPGVLVEGEAVYLYSGFAPKKGFMKTVMKMRKRRIDGAYCIPLEPDMLTIKGEPRLMCPGEDLAAGTSFAEHPFFEASSIRKIGDTYYFVYSSTLSHELCYAVSKSPDKDFVFRGTLVSMGDVGVQGNQEARNYLGNTHGGMAEIRGQWYIFYHRQTNKQKCCRQGCAEKLTILPDGSIPQAEVTSCGLNDGPLPAKGVYEARIACNLGYKEPNFAYLKVREKDKAHPYFTQSGGDREDDPDQYIANMRDGAWAGFKYFQFRGENNISVKIRGEAEGKLLVSTERGEEPVAEILVTPAKEWTDVHTSMKRMEGVKALYFTYQGTGAIDFIEFEIK